MVELYTPEYIFSTERMFDNKRCDPDLNRDIPKETGSQGQRNTRLCDRSIEEKFLCLFK